MTALLCAAACGEGRAGAERGAPATSPDDPVARASERELDADAAAALALADVERSWAQERGRGTRGEVARLAGGVVVVTPGAAPYDCGGTPIAPELLRDNAVFCPATETVLWDRDWIEALLRGDGGLRAVALITAHEFGHAVQARLGLADQEPLGAELQADCFAGAWAAWLVGGRSAIEARAGDVAAVLTTLLDLRDPLGANAGTIDAHGTGFDRVVAFLDGYRDGRARCFGYPDGFAGTTSQGFLDDADEARAGDLPLEAGVLGRLYRDLVAFARAHGLADPARPVPRLEWVDAAEPGCAGVVSGLTPAVGACPDGVVEVRAPGAARLHAIGDLALGAAVAQAWFAASTVARAGDPAPYCLVGAWLGGLHPGAGPDDRELVLSPGDLDEAVRWILSEAGAAWAERLSAFVDGVYEGVAACGP